MYNSYSLWFLDTLIMGPLRRVLFFYWVQLRMRTSINLQALEVVAAAASPRLDDVPFSVSRMILNIKCSRDQSAPSAALRMTFNFDSRRDQSMFWLLKSIVMYGPRRSHLKGSCILVWSWLQFLLRSYCWTMLWPLKRAAATQRCSDHSDCSVQAEIKLPVYSIRKWRYNIIKS